MDSEQHKEVTMPEKIKVAAGTDDGVNLTREHFGDAQQYHIYEVSRDGNYKLVEIRENTTLPLEEEDELHGDPRKFRAVEQLLRDVDIFLARAMGPNFLRVRDESPYIPFIVRGKDKTVEGGLKELLAKWPFP